MKNYRILSEKLLYVCCLMTSRLQTAAATAGSSFQLHKASPRSHPVCFTSTADTGIPEFWLTAMTNHEMVGELVTERDAEVGDSAHNRLKP